MSKKICAKLGDECVRIFDEHSANFNEVCALFGYPDVSNTKEFDANIKLEEDEWFFVVLNDEQKNNMLNQYFRLLVNSASTNQIISEQYREVQAIFLISKDDEQQNYKILFSKITPTARIVNKKFILRNNGDPQLKEINGGIDITGKIDAYRDGEKLYFKRYETIRSLFPGIEYFYQTATPEEVTQFKNNGFFNFSMNDAKIGAGNLKRIAYIVREKRINFSDNEIRKEFKRYAEEYDVSLPFDENNKINIQNNKTLTTAISIIEENYFTAEITKEKKIAEYSKIVNLESNS